VALASEGAPGPQISWQQDLRSEGFIGALYSRFRGSPARVGTAENRYIGEEQQIGIVRPALPSFYRTAENQGERYIEG